jgi:hypothetical protein
MDLQLTMLIIPDKHHISSFSVHFVVSMRRAMLYLLPYQALCVLLYNLTLIYDIPILHLQTLTGFHVYFANKSFGQAMKPALSLACWISILTYQPIKGKVFLHEINLVETHT